MPQTGKPPVTDGSTITASSEEQKSKVYTLIDADRADRNTREGNMTWLILNDLRHAQSSTFGSVWGIVRLENGLSSDPNNSQTKEWREQFEEVWNRIADELAQSATERGSDA